MCQFLIFLMLSIIFYASRYFETTSSNFCIIFIHGLNDVFPKCATRVVIFHTFNQVIWLKLKKKYLSWKWIFWECLCSDNTLKKWSPTSLKIIQTGVHKSILLAKNIHENVRSWQLRKTVAHSTESTLLYIL